MKRLFFASFVLLAPTLALADASVVVDHARIVLSDVVPGAPAEQASFDLGPAPPPGGSVVLTPEAIASKLGDAGAKVSLPAAPVRVQSAARSLSAHDLAELTRPSIESALRPGVRLVRVDSSVGATLSPRAKVKSVSVPRVHQKGQERVTAMVELARDDETLLRLPVMVTLDVDEQGAKMDVPRGSRVSLLVREGRVEIRADATTAGDGDVGDVVPVAVTRTGKSASARLMRDGTAEMVSR